MHVCMGLCMYLCMYNLVHVCIYLTTYIKSSVHALKGSKQVRFKTVIRCMLHRVKDTIGSS